MPHRTPERSNQMYLTLSVLFLSTALIVSVGAIAAIPFLWMHFEFDMEHGSDPNNISPGLLQLSPDDFVVSYKPPKQNLHPECYPLPADSEKQYSKVKFRPGRMLFIHIPKSAGTSLTAYMRSVQCQLDPVEHKECCVNPGSCYIKGERRCLSIIGCVSHYPRM